MLVKTVSRNFNKPMMVNIEGKSFELFFDVTGECNIKDEKLAKAVVEKYKGLIFPKETEIEQPKTIDEKITEETVNNLKLELNRVKESLKNKKEEYEILEKDLQAWKDKYNETVLKVEEAKKLSQEELNKATSLQRKAEFEVGLWKSSMNELKKLCKDAEFNKEEYEKFVKKEDLIEFILKKG